MAGLPAYPNIKWVEDGGFYYLKDAGSGDYILQAGESTPELFTHIRLEPNVKEGEVVPAAGENGKAVRTVEVTAQAVQTGSFADAAAAWAAFDAQN